MIIIGYRSHFMMLIIGAPGGRRGPGALAEPLTPGNVGLSPRLH
jgi:hypothetical protein